MRREFIGVLLAAATALIAGCSQAGEKADSMSSKVEESTGGVFEGTISGVISDSMCGKDHSVMGEMGKDPAACTKKCVEGGAKYVLVESKSGDVYSLSDQDKFADLGGKSVSIEGHIDPSEKSIHVHSVTNQ